MTLFGAYIADAFVDGSVRLRRRLNLSERLAVKQPLHQSPWLLVAILITGLAGFEYKVQQPDPVSGGESLSLRVERRGSDLLMTWDRSAPAILKSKAGLLHILDGNDLQQDLRLDADQLRHGSVLYTPLTNNVQFRMEVSGKDGKAVNERVWALAAPLSTPPAKPEQPPLGADALRHRPVWYAVQVGTFRNRGNADRLRNEMEARYGPSRLVSQANNPALWRVLVGHDQTSESASRLAQRIRADRGEPGAAVLVIRENSADSL